MRFSDEKLTKMHDEIQDISRRFNDHVSFETQRMDTLVKAIETNTKSISTLSDETRSIVKIHNDIQATARVGKTLQSFLLWLTKWGVIGAALATAIRWLLELVKS